MPYNLIAHKEMRLLIPALPFLFILAGYGLVCFAGLFKKNKTPVLSLLLLAFFVLNTANLGFDGYEDSLDIFYDYIGNEEISNGLWISNPAFIAYSDEKAEELIYYPLYSSGKIDELAEKVNSAKHILINSCDILPCPPYDNFCDEKHIDFVNFLKERFDAQMHEIHGTCEYYIFSQ